MKYKDKPFYVIVYNVNSNDFEKYNVMTYFIDCYKDAKKKKSEPKTKGEFLEFVKSKSMYMYWSRCEWEILCSSWPCEDVKKKIDVHYQIMNNIDLVVEVLMYNVGAK